MKLKKSILSLILFLLFIFPTLAQGATNQVYFSRTCLTGGGAACLDNLDGSTLNDGDIAFVTTGNLLYVYKLNAASGAAESSPLVISPDTNAGNKRWILQTSPYVHSTTDSAGGIGITGPTTGNLRTKTVRDAADTLLELGGSYTPTGTWNWGGSGVFGVGSDASGDMYYRASSSLARLAKGTENFKLFMNSTAAAPEWAKGIKVGTFTRDLTASSGDVAITGVGFKPSALITFGTVTTGTIGFSIGFSDGNAGYSSEVRGSTPTYDSTGGGLWQTFDGTNQHYAILKSFDSDGFTLTWTKVNTPTGTMNCYYLALR